MAECVGDGIAAVGFLTGHDGNRKGGGGSAGGLPMECVIDCAPGEGINEEKQFACVLMTDADNGCFSAVAMGEAIRGDWTSLE